MEYTKHHIMDINIEDETQRHGRDISVFVDTHEMVNIEIGNTITIRTDECGIDDFRDALHRAVQMLDEVRYQKITAQMNKSEDDMIQAGIDAREATRNKVRSEQQRVDPYETFNANDPVNW